MKNKFTGICIESGNKVAGHLLTNKIGTYIITQDNPQECIQYGYIEIDDYHRVHPITVRPVDNSMFWGSIVIFTLGLVMIVASLLIMVKVESLC